MDRIDLEYGTLWLDKVGIIHAVYKPGVHMTLAMAEESNARLIELGGGAARPLLIDVRPLRSMDGDARAFFASAGGPSAVALLVDSPLSRILANFFIGLNRHPTIPTRLFTDEGAALNWLKGFVQ